MVCKLIDLARFGRPFICFLCFRCSTRSQRLEPVSDVIEADLGEFQELQNVISEYLNANDSSQANAM